MPIRRRVEKEAEGTNICNTFCSCCNWWHIPSDSRRVMRLSKKAEVLCDQKQKDRRTYNPKHRCQFDHFALNHFSTWTCGGHCVRLAVSAKYLPRVRFVPSVGMKWCCRWVNSILIDIRCYFNMCFNAYCFLPQDAFILYKGEPPKREREVRQQDYRQKRKKGNEG